MMMVAHVPIVGVDVWAKLPVVPKAQDRESFRMSINRFGKLSEKRIVCKFRLQGMKLAVVMGYQRRILIRDCLIDAFGHLLETLKVLFRSEINKSMRSRTRDEHLHVNHLMELLDIHRRDLVAATWHDLDQSVRM